MPVTIKDIARRAGVSHTTVSRAMRQSALISPNTTDRIHQIAEEMGYRPSAAARSLKTNHSQVLGVILSHIADPYFSEILQGIDDIAQENGYSLFIASAQHDPAHQKAIVQTMREHRVDGVILCSPHLTPEQSSQLNSYNIPIVAVNNQADEDFPYAIYHDDLDGGMQVSQHLIDLGHQRIAYLGDATAGRTTHERLSGFKQSMLDAGLIIRPEYIHLVEGNSAEQGHAGLKYFLALPVPPTAIMCYNDMLAVGVLKGLDVAGWKVPGSISVTGFDNILISNFTHPSLTTIDQPKRFLGAEAARMMLEQVRNVNLPGGIKGQVKILKGTLVIRESTGVPSQG